MAGMGACALPLAPLRALGSPRCEGVCLGGPTLPRSLCSPTCLWGGGDPFVTAAGRGCLWLQACGLWGAALSQGWLFVPCHPPVAPAFSRRITAIPLLPPLTPASLGILVPSSSSSKLSITATGGGHGDPSPAPGDVIPWQGRALPRVWAEGSGGAWAGQGSRDVPGRVSCSCPRPVGSYSLARCCPIEPIFLPQWCRSHVMSCAWSQPDLRFAGASGASCEISRQNSAPQQPHPPGALWPLQPPILCPIKVGMTKVGI